MGGGREARNWCLLLWSVVYLKIWTRFHCLLLENGNRYEGHFARGFKNGEGTYYHMHTGQIQKGMWENDVCKVSMVIDEFRNQVDSPTPYPIPKVISFLSILKA